MEIKSFGIMKNGEEDRLYTLKNANGVEITVHTFGAGLYSIVVPDRYGKKDDILLGYSKPDDYDGCDDYSGLVVGPVANRINGDFTIDGKTYSPEVNPENGIILHSNGDMSFRNWAVTDYTDNSISLSIGRTDGTAGLPANITAIVTYTLSDDNELSIVYKAVPDRTAYINLTNHAYFNLDGCSGADVLDHEVKFNCDYFVPTDENSIPYGETKAVDGTPFDLREFKRIGERIDDKTCDQTVWGRGYDHSLEIRDCDGSLRLAATVRSEKTGRKLECFTTLPAVQFYTGNFLCGLEGKYGFKNNRRSGFCLETQYHPDAVHHKAFAQPVFDEENPYESETVYKFSVE
ncbi:MAG: galactose mutarotase [Clostridia bacterium]|nr:galactose mutarotase [Clostridia bacterium]